MRPWWKSSSRPTIGAESRSDSSGFLDLDPGRGELVDFPFVMGDIKNRQAQIVADAADHFHDLAAAGGVSDDSGSSINRKRGPASSARPIATRCASPPDNVAGQRASRCPNHKKYS